VAIQAVQNEHQHEFGRLLDQPGLLDWLFSTFKDRPNLAAPTIFITHGGESQRRDLQTAIEARSAEWTALHGDRHPDVTVHRRKKRDGWFDLDAGRWASSARPDPSSIEAALKERVQSLEERLAAIEAILRAEGKLP